MPQQETQQGSEYNQESFIGGMNLLLDDTHLEPNQYRLGINVRNRYDSLSPTLKSQQDVRLPVGIVQEHTTFGEFEIAFISGAAYYKHYTGLVWTKIEGFSMSTFAPRYWTKAVPVSTTNYVRYSAINTIDAQNFASAGGPIFANSVAGSFGGNLPGLVVQDNINQPQFIFLDQNGFPTVRVTQTFAQWKIIFTDATNETIAEFGDQREYVPVGNAMEYIDGVLYVVSPDFKSIYRSVSGRPLDFVVNVPFQLATGSNFTMIGGGDATTTSYSVGVGNISCLRALADNSLFVSASNANFSVSKNTTPNAPTQFGEYTFVRKFLFNAVCLSDRSIIDSIGDTRFITLTGVRSFNAVQQTQNEGRNSPFSAYIRPAFGPEDSPIIQSASAAACILFNDYEFYAVDTIFGPAIAVYDTINKCWTSLDLDQTGGKRIKMFSKIELSVQILFAVTEDNKVYRLYVGPNKDVALCRTLSVCSNIIYAGQNVRLANPKMEVKLNKVRAILNGITESCTFGCTPYANNRLASTKMTKAITFYNGVVEAQTNMDDAGTQLENMLFSFPDALQGWKVYSIFEWTEGNLTQFSMELTDLTPQNPLRSQATSK